MYHFFFESQIYYENLSHNSSWFFRKNVHNARMRTHQYREIILETCHCRHLSADDIFEEIQKTHPKVGRATIYRNIEKMFEENLLRKIPGPNCKNYFESNDEPHAHLVDDRSKIFCDFPIENINLKNLPEGYEVAEICIHIKKTL